VTKKNGVWRATLALRWRVLRRRFVSPLEATILLVVTGLAYLVGRQLGARLPEQVLLSSGLSAILVGATLAGSRIAHTLLYGARELALLIPNGVAPRTLVRVRVLECMTFGTLALLPVLGFVSGAALGQGQLLSPLVLAAAPIFGCALAGLSLLGAWVFAQLPRRVPTVGVVLLGVGAAVASLVVPALVKATLSHVASPGGALVALAGGDAIGLAAPLTCGVLALFAVDVLVARGYSRGIDRASQRKVGTVGGLWPMLRTTLRPLGQQAAALLTRDLALIARGGFPRGVVILSALPLSLVVVRLAATDSATRDWHLQFVGLLLAGVLGSAAGFLFGVDFPRARRGCLLLERSQPVRARAVLLSRWVPAILYGGALVLVIAGIVASADRASLARQWVACLGKGLLAVVITSHHAVVYGMRSEAQLDPAEAAAYPLNGGVVVVLFALLLLWSPLGALAYPLVWFGFAKAAMTRWEIAEIESMHGAAA
jgi:hypothetical protein